MEKYIKPITKQCAKKISDQMENYPIESQKRWKL